MTMSTVPCVLQCRGLAMKPLMPFLQRVGLVSRRRPCFGADLTRSETSMQPLIGVKVPSDNVSMIHIHGG